MKKLFLLILMCVGINCFAQLKAKVNKVNGIEVYLLAEPVREYETLKVSGKGVQWGSAITGGLINESISTKVTKYIKKLSKKFEEENITFDAIIYSSGKQMTAIKFTDKKTDENNRIATVNKIDGIPFFVMSEPINNYEHVKTVGGGIKWKSALTAGIINNSIEQDLSKFAKKMSRKFRKKEISAIIYERGKKASAIKFND